MHIVLLCASRRGLSFFERLRSLCPDDRLTVFSFREEPWEPPYLSLIRRFAEDNGASFFEARNVASDEFAPLWDEPVDLIFVVGWRYLLPMPLVNRARLAAVAFHDSRLPAYRGFAPTVWAIINGETSCGATMFHLAEEMDAGDIIDQVSVEVGEEETIADVMEKVTTAYLTMLERNLEALTRGSAARLQQEHSLATYTCKRTPEDNLIDWKQPAHAIHNLVRAVTHPYTGAFTFYRGAKMTIWSARRYPLARRYVGSIPGRVIEIIPGEGVVVLTGEGALLVRTVEVEDGREVCAAEIINTVAARLG